MVRTSLFLIALPILLAPAAMAQDPVEFTVSFTHGQDGMGHWNLGIFVADDVSDIPDPAVRQAFLEEFSPTGGGRYLGIGWLGAVVSQVKKLICQQPLTVDGRILEFGLVGVEFSATSIGTRSFDLSRVDFTRAARQVMKQAIGGPQPANSVQGVARFRELPPVRSFQVLCRGAAVEGALLSPHPRLGSGVARLPRRSWLTGTGGSVELAGRGTPQDLWAVTRDGSEAAYQELAGIVLEAARNPDCPGHWMQGIQDYLTEFLVGQDRLMETGSALTLRGERLRSNPEVGVILVDSCQPILRIETLQRITLPGRGRVALFTADQPEDPWTASVRRILNRPAPEGALGSVACLPVLHRIESLVKGHPYWGRVRPSFLGIKVDFLGLERLALEQADWTDKPSSETIMDLDQGALLIRLDHPEERWTGDLWSSFEEGPGAILGGTLGIRERFGRGGSLGVHGGEDRIGAQGSGWLRPWFLEESGPRLDGAAGAAWTRDGDAELGPDRQIERWDGAAWLSAGLRLPKGRWNFQAILGYEGSEAEPMDGTCLDDPVATGGVFLGTTARWILPGSSPGWTAGALLQGAMHSESLGSDRDFSLARLDLSGGIEGARAGAELRLSGGWMEDQAPHHTRFQASDQVPTALASTRGVSRAALPGYPEARFTGTELLAADLEAWLVPISAVPRLRLTAGFAGAQLGEADRVDLAVGEFEEILMAPRVGLAWQPEAGLLEARGLSGVVSVSWPMDVEEESFDPTVSAALRLAFPHWWNPGI